MNIEVKITDNRRIGLFQKHPGAPISVFHVNGKGEFVGVATIPQEIFAKAIEELVPVGNRYWR